MNDKNNTPPAGQPGKINGTSTVVVGCKLPNGLVCEMGKRGDSNYTSVVLNGSNSSRIAHGYGLTTVSRDFWDAWFKDHSHKPFVRGGHVFVHDTESGATGHAKEMATLRTGLEPVDPTRPVLGRAPDGTEVKVEADMEHFERARANAGRR